MVKHRPHDEIPLVVFGLLAATLVVGQLLKISNLHAIALSSYLTIFASLSAVMVVVRQWRYS